MEAAFISLLINKLGGVAVDQAKTGCFQLLLQFTTPPIDRINTRVGRITGEFEMMQAFLKRSNWSTAVATNEPLQAWIEQVREAAFKIEDIIDEYHYLVGRQRESTWKNFLMAPLDILCFNLPRAWRGIDSRLEKMETHVSDLTSRKDRYGVTISTDNDDRVKNSETESTYHYRAYSPMLIDHEDDLVGIEVNKSKLVSWLTDVDTCRKMMTIAVWGMAGHGKTTLVANVYRNDAVKSHFDCQVWITVSETYRVKELLRTMIHEIFKGKTELVPNGTTDMRQEDLFKIIRKNLQGKRYIIVLDDVWDKYLWDKIHHAFVDSDNGSRVIVTTRKLEVARIANEEHMIELQQLDEKDAWILFCKKAFQRSGNSRDCPKELEDYTGRILNKCQGSPLAIVAIGGLLSFKKKSESEWKKVHDCLHSEFQRNNSELNEVKSILNLSFNDLPYYLKNCFVYCSIFPEDYLIKRKKLIRLWVAEGFITTRSSNISMEEEAEDYLSEFVDRSMLQVVKRNEFGRMKAFRMHDVVREVTLAISKKAKFCMNLDGSQSVLDDQTRRLSLQTNDDKSLDLNMSLSRVCSLIAFSTYKIRNSAVLISFKMLRVLELEGVPISNLPNEVSDLFNLHYLGLKDTKVEYFPGNIQKLQSLQTLDVSYSNVWEIPLRVKQLKQLRHLIGGTSFYGVPIREGSWQCKNLQTLKNVHLTEKFVHGLGDMKELRTLEITAVKPTHCPQLCTSLTNMRKLRCLRLELFGDEEEEQFNFEMLNSPPLRLQKLDLKFYPGGLFEGKLPTFICSCTELIHVKLSGSHLIEDPLPPLGQLQKLVVLKLRNDAYEGQKLHFRTGWFLNLKRLYLVRLKNLNNIVIEEGAMTSLYELDMRYLLELKMVPRGIEFLTHLQEITLVQMPKELVGKLKEDDGNEEDRQWIKRIPIVSIS